MNSGRDGFYLGFCLALALCAGVVACSGEVDPELACSDGAKNGSETDIDCGGDICLGCLAGKTCNRFSDCISGVCEAGMCLPPAGCLNDKKDGSETDVDCGGGSCPGCTAGKTCLAPRDCGAGFLCNETAMLCEADPCQNETMDGNETDVDCGGDSCPACAAGKMCGVPTDCQSMMCAANVCEGVDPCSNGVMDGNESDLDCGGGTCAPCGAGKMCTVAGDCQSGMCDGTMLCAGIDPCTNTVLDGMETDVDCGGNICDKCVDNKLCKVDTDCMSGICDMTESMPRCEAADTCGNSRMETGEYCDDGNIMTGDGCGAGCLKEDGEVCAAPEECESNTCTANACAPA